MELFDHFILNLLQRKDTQERDGMIDFVFFPQNLNDFFEILFDLKSVPNKRRLKKRIKSVNSKSTKAQLFFSVCIHKYLA